jgi:hypothetical protein
MSIVCGTNAEIISFSIACTLSGLSDELESRWCWDVQRCSSFWCYGYPICCSGTVPHYLSFPLDHAKSWFTKFSSRLSMFPGSSPNLVVPRDCNLRRSGLPCRSCLHVLANWDQRTSVRRLISGGSFEPSYIVRWKQNMSAICEDYFFTALSQRYFVTNDQNLYHRSGCVWILPVLQISVTILVVCGTLPSGSWNRN